MNIGGKDNETLEAYFNYCCCGICRNCIGSIFISGDTE